MNRPDKSSLFNFWLKQNLQKFYNSNEYYLESINEQNYANRLLSAFDDYAKQKKNSNTVDAIFIHLVLNNNINYFLEQVILSFQHDDFIVRKFNGISNVSFSELMEYSSRVSSEDILKHVSFGLTAKFIGVIRADNNAILNNEFIMRYLLYYANPPLLLLKALQFSCIEEICEMSNKFYKDLKSY
jgi:ethanolamine ammonia-lyase large subunit